MTGIARVAVLLGCAIALPACGVADFFEDRVPRRKIDLPPSSAMYAEERVEAVRALHLMNEERARAGLPAFRWDEQATGVAYDHAVDMRVRGFYTHTNPDGETPCDRLHEVGIVTFGCGAENIARGEDTAEEVVEVWMNSPVHEKNILSILSTHVGVGVTMGAEGPWWSVHFFIPMSVLDEQ